MPDIDRTLLETRCFLEAIGVRVWIDEFDELKIEVPEIPAERMCGESCSIDRSSSESW